MRLCYQLENIVNRRMLSIRLCYQSKNAVNQRMLEYIINQSMMSIIIGVCCQLEYLSIGVNRSMLSLGVRFMFKRTGLIYGLTHEIMLKEHILHGENACMRTVIS